MVILLTGIIRIKGSPYSINLGIIFLQSLKGGFDTMVVRGPDGCPVGRKGGIPS